MPGGWGVGVDYIVFGMGYGATLLVLGWVLRTFGPGWRYRDDDSRMLAGADTLVHRLAWVRFVSALGSVVTVAGAATVLVTFLTALINPGDHAGAIVLWVTFALVLIGAGVWTWFFVARYGADGLVPERLDIGRLLEPRQPQMAHPRRATRPHADQTAPEPELDNLVRPSDVPEPDGRVDEDVAGYDDEPGYDDDTDILEARYSRFQLHHPDEPHDDAYQDLFSLYGVDDVDVSAERSAVEEPEDESDGETTIEIDDSSTWDDDEFTDEFDDAPIREDEDDLPDDPEDDMRADEVIEDEHEVEGSEDDDEVVAVDFDADAPLPDTPEGRAEALRRLQAWEPDADA